MRLFANTFDYKKCITNALMATYSRLCYKNNIISTINTIINYSRQHNNLLLLDWTTCFF